MPTVSIDRGQFWTEVKQLAKSQEADEVLVYMHLMLEKARAARPRPPERHPIIWFKASAV